MIGKSKKKPVTVETFTKTERPPINQQVEHLEFVAGRQSGEGVYNTRGCKLEAETILVQTHPANRFLICTRIGGRWYETAKVAPDDPVVMALQEAGRFVERGPSPSELESKRRKEEQEAHELRLEEWKKQERQAVHEERRRRAEEKEALARAERRAGM